MEAVSDSSSFIQSKASPGCFPPGLLGWVVIAGRRIPLGAEAKSQLQASMQTIALK